MKIFLCIILIISFTNASILKKIDSTKKEVKIKEKRLKHIKNKLELSADKILKERAEKKSLEKEISILENILNKNKSKYEKDIKNYASLNKKLNKLNKEKILIKNKISNIIVKSLIISPRDKEVIDTKDFINKYVSKSIIKVQEEKLLHLEDQYENIIFNNKIINKKILFLGMNIKKVNEKRKELKYKIINKNKLIKKLKKEEKIYQVEFNKNIQESKNLNKILKNLQKKQKNIEIAKLRKINKQKNKVNIYNVKVKRRYSKNTQKLKIKKYIGLKTEAPFKKYNILKNFGKHIDKLYDIEVFNENVSLESLKEYEKVRSILNGKIVVVHKDKLLGNVVVIEHKNGITTTYAKLSHIPSYIKKGKRVRKGKVIGRVKKELIFRVNQGDKLINPLQIIKRSLV